MLIVCNGLYKSGSTWIYMFLVELLKQSEVPSRLVSKSSGYDLAGKYSQVLEFALERDVVVKIHNYDEKFLDRMKADGAFIISSERSFVDITLSHYFHFTNEKIRLPFSVYVATVGFVKLLELHVYRQNSTKRSNTNFHIIYEELKSDSRLVFASLARELGYVLTQGELSELVDKVDLRGKALPGNDSISKKRQWFLKRDSASSASGNVSKAKFMVNFAEQVVRIPGVLRLLQFVFLTMRKIHLRIIK